MAEALTSIWFGPSVSALPGRLDVNLFGDSQRVINLYAEVSDRALDLGVTEQQLYGSEIAGASVDEGGLRSPERAFPNKCGSSPTLETHSETSRAYWRVVMQSL